MTFKEQVYNLFQQLLSDKISLLQNTLADLKASASSETKSTAGDKHETALAMLQIEQANTGRQLSELWLQKELFDKIDPKIRTLQITKGSLIKTNNGYLFLSVALGRILVDGISVIALSPQSPLGSKLLEFKINDSVEVNGKIYLVESLE